MWSVHVTEPTNQLSDSVFYAVTAERTKTLKTAAIVPKREDMNDSLQFYRISSSYNHSLHQEEVL